MNKFPGDKKIKKSNSIAIGGMIALGKSTLCEELNKELKNSEVVFELNEQDELMKLLLKKMYERNNENLYGPMFQLYFILNRFENYNKNCNREKLTIFDRTIFEDWLFARENINNPEVFNYYNSLWNSVCNNLIYNVGTPILYIILDGDWDIFKERIYLRNREVEIQNFLKNEEYFRHLLKIYRKYMVEICQNFGINYIVLDARTPTEDKIKLIKQKLKELNE